MLAVISGVAQNNTPPQRQLDVQLKNTRYVVLQGTFIPATQVLHEGQLVQIPDLCRFRYHNPKGPALGWQQVGETIFRKGAKTCEGAFVEGEVADQVSPPAAPLGQYNYKRVRFTDPWLDPINLVVASASAEVAWNYNQPCGSDWCALYIAGTFYVDGLQLTGWTFYIDTKYGINMNGYQNWVGYGGRGSAVNFLWLGCTPLNPAIVYFIPTEVYGDNGGSWDGYSVSTASGSCSNSLRPGVKYFTILADQ